MRTVVLFCAVAYLVAPEARAQAVASDQDVLIDLERRWNQAFMDRDVAFIDSILAEEFVVTYADGERGDRDKEMALAREFNQQIDSNTVDEFIVKVYRDTAVVWFTQRLVGPIQGKPTEINYRYMDVWVIRDGRWQCVASQSTRVGSR